MPEGNRWIAKSATFRMFQTGSIFRAGFRELSRDNAVSPNYQHWSSSFHYSRKEKGERTYQKPERQLIHRRWLDTSGLQKIDKLGGIQPNK